MVHLHHGGGAPVVSEGRLGDGAILDAAGEVSLVTATSVVRLQGFRSVRP